MDTKNTHLGSGDATQTYKKAKTETLKQNTKQQIQNTFQPTTTEQYPLNDLHNKDKMEQPQLVGHRKNNQHGMRVCWRSNKLTLEDNWTLQGDIKKQMATKKSKTTTIGKNKRHQEEWDKNVTPTKICYYTNP
jgi:hypothetical protein